MIQGVTDGTVNLSPERPYLVQPPNRVHRIAQQHYRDAERRCDRDLRYR